MTDLATTRQSPDVPAQQRAIVERQLAAMRAGNPPRHFHVAGMLLAGRAPLSLLDAGCSSGYYYDITQFYAMGKVDYTGCDYSEAMLAMARERYPGVKFTCADLLHLPYAAGAFDAVLTGATLNLISDWQAALQELKRVARHYLILHRAWVQDTEPTYSTIELGYGHGYQQWHWRADELRAACAPFRLVDIWDAEGTLACGCRSLTYLLERP